MSEPAIDVRGLGVRFDLSLSRGSSIRGAFSDWKGPFRRNGKVRHPHFWALRKVDLTIGHGESVGLVGPNGAGKSTLLLVLASILLPNEGSVTINGRVSTLLTLGAGFERELTGVENIRLSAAFLGLSRREIEAVVPRVIEFADIGDFIDAEVRTYSTGMRARLGFAMATVLDPDILLLDEVLGTGDQSFRAKSQAKIRELAGSARAIVLVSHDLTSLADYCPRSILVEQGTVVADGATDNVVALYRERVRERKLLKVEDVHRFDEGTAEQSAAPPLPAAQ